jgi:tetratricopeptide (TPR) repeat protein
LSPGLPYAKLFSKVFRFFCNLRGYARKLQKKNAQSSSQREFMAQNVMLQEALDAIAHGQNSRARDLLMRLLRADQSDPVYWLWMSAVVETPKERIYCLQNVLRLEPNNQSARLGLVLYGASKPPSEVSLPPFAPRKWSVAEEEALFLEHTASSRNNRRLATYIGAALLVLLFMVVGFIRFGSPAFSGANEVHLTITPRFRTPTPTITQRPTDTPRQRKTSIVPGSPTPLWMLLNATYTPTPLYVNTPHPISEAYQAGLRAYEDRDFESMLRYMEQAAQVEPNSADLHYFVGEAFHALKNPLLALAAYDQSIEVDPNFAPAYLGRARVNLDLDPSADVEDDLQYAIALDPNLVEAYLQRADIHISQEKYADAFDDLDEVELLAHQSPLLYLYRAQAYLVSGKIDLALENAQTAFNLDQTSLPAYLTLGQASLLNGNPGQTVDKLNIYLLYQPQDFLAWSILGQAYYEQAKDFSSALAALNKALDINKEYFPALLYRGLTYLELREGQLAVNDLFNARNLERTSFLASLGLGRGLQQTDRLEDAISQMSASLSLATTDLELAQVYYWRALAREALGDLKPAANDWQALMALKDKSIPETWLKIAQQHLTLLTPSPTATPTAIPKTPTPTRISPTSSSSLTPTPIKTPTKSPTRTPTPTIQKTPTNIPATATKTPTS